MSEFETGQEWCSADRVSKRASCKLVERVKLMCTGRIQVKAHRLHREVE
jgi:hypothetical protein